MAALFVVLFQEERHLKRQRVFRNKLNPLDSLCDVEVIERYRLPRQHIFALCDLINDDISPICNGSHPIPAVIKVLVTLRYLGKGSFFSECGDLHGISKSSVCRAVEDVTTSICERVDNIKFPTRDEDVLNIKIIFFTIAAFPNVIGAIDGTLIPIIAPKDNEADFVCRKGFHAINVQAVADDSLRFTNIVCRWPGSVHVSFIFNNSALFQLLETNNTSGWLLGDSGYGLKQYLMTPKLNPSTQAEEKYNIAHAKTRVVIERAFGVCKSRFRCIHKTGGCLPFAPIKCNKIITAVFKLHNKCIAEHLPMPIWDDNTDGANDDNNVNNQHYHEVNQCVNGQNTRERLIQRFA